MVENPIQKWLYHKHHILENIRNFTFHAPSWNMVCIAVLLYNYWIQIFRNQQKKFQYYFEMQLHNFCYLLSVLTNLFKNHQNFNILLCSRFSGEIVSLSPLITLPPLPPIRPCCRNSSSVFAPNRLWHNLTRVSSWVSGWFSTWLSDQ